MGKRKIRPPFPCYGGKYTHVEKILPLFPPHHTYVEVFGGAASLLLNKEPSAVEVYNDVDGGAVNFFRILRDNPDELIRRLLLTPYSREEYDTGRKHWHEPDDDVEKARRWFFVASNSYNGRFGEGFSVSARRSHGGIAAHAHTYFGRVANLYLVAERMAGTIIEHLDFRDLIPKYDTPETLYYCDPPYVIDTRHPDGTYVHEMSQDDHRDLVKILLEIEGMAVVSGYRHEIYEPLEKAGWLVCDYSIVAPSSSRVRRKEARRVETLWVSPRAAEALRRGHKFVWRIR